MYNDNIKQRYLDYVGLESDVKRIIAGFAFKNIKMFEEAYSKDACNFNTSEIENMYKTLNYKTISLVRNLNSVLLQYTQWCQGEALVVDGINHYEEFYGDRMHSYTDPSYVEEGLITRELLLEIAEQMLNKIDSFAIIAIFEGFGGIGREDFMTATINDIEGNVLRLKDRTIEVSDEFIDYAKLCHSQEAYKSRNGERYDTLLDDSSELIYKPLAKNQTNKTRYRTIGTRIKNELDALGYLKVTLHDVERAGRVHYIKSKSEEIGVTPREFCYRYTDKLANQFRLSNEYVSGTLYDSIKKFLE